MKRLTQGYPKGTKAYCVGCRSHIFTLAEGVYDEVAIEEMAIEDPKGKPMYAGEALECSVCFMPFWVHAPYFEEAEEE